MAFQVSPGVQVTEKDLALVIPQVTASVGATAGLFRWGPAETPITVTNEGELAANFGRPTGVNNFVVRSFLTAANFLSYSSNMVVVRALPSSAYNAASEGSLSDVPAGYYANGVTAQTEIQIKNDNDYINDYSDEPASTSVFVAKYPGELGNAIKVSMADADSFLITTVDSPVSFQEELLTLASGDVNVTASSTSSTSVTINAAYDGTLSPGDQLYVADANTTPSTLVFLGIVGVQYTSGTTITLATNATVSLTGATRKLYKVTNKIFGTDLDKKIVANSTVVKFGNKNLGKATSVTTTSATFSSPVSNTLSTTELIGTGATGTTTQVTFEWEYRDEFVVAPAATQYAESKGLTTLKDEIHIIVIDETGVITGVVGQVLEKYTAVSKLFDAVKTDGESLYYKSVINRSSSYIRFLRQADDIIASAFLNTTNASSWGSSYIAGALGSNTVMTTMKIPYVRTLRAGTNGFDASTSAHTPSVITALQTAFDVFTNTEEVDVGLISVGEVESTVAKYVIQNIAEVRKDCVVFVSAVIDNGTSLQVATKSTDVTNIISYRTGTQNAVNVSSSYAVMDSGYKYQYDKYNDQYLYVPLNGDIAGLCARTDFAADPWFSPGGFNRGQIKNIVKLAYNPSQADRDNLYKNGINPVATFPGQGTVLFGDKTMLARPSAFDRINVRRLFIILEKAIATAAKFQLFELNDTFSRAQFKNLVEPFLRDVQGRRGVTDFRVICDDTNNTGEVIDRNEFVADIFIKPSRSINFITLNFVAVRSSVNFDEIGG
jgi:phage tail sheath protein FI